MSGLAMAQTAVARGRGSRCSWEYKQVMLSSLSLGGGGWLQPQVCSNKCARRTKLAACRATENGDSELPPFGFGAPFADEIDRSPVPREQVPINEFKCLQESSYFSWALDSVRWYVFKLAGVGTSCALLLGWPVAWLSVSQPELNVSKCLLAASSAGLVASTLAALRLYIGWAHVGNRLFSAAVEYEETGWYDGQAELAPQMWMKPPQTLARDRLVGSYTVKPAVHRVKLTLLSLALLLLASVISFYAVPPSSSSHDNGGGSGSGDGAMVSYTSNYDAKSAEQFEPEALCGSGGNEQ